MSVTVNKLLVKDTGNESSSTPIRPVRPEEWQSLTESEREDAAILARFAKTQGFKGKPGQMLIVPDSHSGDIEAVYLGTDSPDDMWAFSGASATLPEGVYHIDDTLSNGSDDQMHKAAVGWALAHYSYKVREGKLESDPEARAKLLVPAALYDEVEHEVQATWQVRDLINAPANVLNTKELAGEVLDLAAEFNAASGLVEGEELEKEFPLVHAVGKASVHEPCLAHFSWSGSQATADSPTILLVGKGVTFDTGGVQIKPGASMESMKKDMGGAATVLGLARMVMANDLAANLKVVVPIAENAVSSNAFRPQDIITARDGTEIEISHTDAEGRLILADALSFGVGEADPDLIMDFATLTGAQRVADGLEVGGVFSNSKNKGRVMEDIGAQWNDDLQLHHLFEKYRPLLRSHNGGDLASSPKAGGGPGATLAAMFLQHFTRAARQETQWFHFDINGANPSSKPGRPAGGEAIGMRAAYRYLKSELGL